MEITVGATERLGRVAVLVAFVFSVGCTTEHLAPPPPRLPEPLAAFGRLPNIEMVALSPRGSRIALVNTTEENQRVIAMVSLADRTTIATLRAGDAKLRDIKWIDEDRLLIITSTTAVGRGLVGLPREWEMLQVYDTNRRKVRPVLNGTEEGTMNVAAGRVMARRVGGHSMLFVGGGYSPTLTAVRPGLFRIDLDTGDEELVRKGSIVTRGWLVDDAGDVVAEQDYDERQQRWTIRIRRGGTFTDVASGADPFDLSHIAGFALAGAALEVKTLDGVDTTWKVLSLKDGTLTPETRDPGNRVLLDRSDRVIGWVQREDDPWYSFLDPATEEHWKQVLKIFEGRHVRLVSNSDDYSKFVVLVGAPNGYDYDLVEPEEHRVTSVGPQYIGLPELSHVQRITYSAADGLEIVAYVTFPHGRPVKRLPLIVLPHGGPADHDAGEFDWWAQALAASGYAVLQPNYRGSDVDPGLLAAGFGEWGRKMQTDLSDGVRFLAEKGVIDPTRVCIVGASYGGYAAVAGVTLDPGVYRCAVSVAGISDVRRFVEWVNERHGWRYKARERYWDRFMGASGPGDPTLEAISPIRHVATVSVPVLLVHGRDDTVVPYEQSAMMARALEGAGKSVELVALDGEDHWLSRGATRLRMLEHMLAFLAVYNPATP